MNLLGLQFEEEMSIIVLSLLLPLVVGQFPPSGDCPDGEHSCQFPFGSMCIPLALDYDGEECPFQQCPMMCNDDEVFCAGECNEVGCCYPNMCLPKMMSDSGEWCPGVCPVRCGPEEAWCRGGVDEFGCQTQDMCLPKAVEIGMRSVANNEHIVLL